VVGAAAAPPQGAGAPPPVSGAPMADNVASALCYVLGIITGVIFLVIPPYNQNKAVRFHAFQSIFFSLAWIAGSIVLGIVLGIFHMWFIGFGIHSLYNLVGFVLWVYLLITTFQGKTTVLPLIGPIAQQQA
jgi:uncharacterized membrane protein